MPLIKFSPTERRRLSLFIVCLAVAVTGWLFFALSNRYVYRAETVLRFVNFPQNKAFHSLQSDTVDLQIEGTGWQILFSRLRISPESIDIDLKDLNKQTFVNLSDQLGYINRQFSSTQKIVYIQPDTLYFDFSARATKRVPIELVSHISFYKQYGIADSVRILPSYVTVTGPREELAGIHTWKTDSLILKNVSGNVSSKISLVTAAKTNISIYPRVAEVQIPVDEFTEKSVEVPVTVINNRNFYDVRLLPEKVKITFMTAVGNYQKIDRDYFAVTADLDKWRDKSYKQLPLRVSKFPEFCRLVRIEPQAVDFIIQR